MTFMKAKLFKRDIGSNKKSFTLEMKYSFSVTGTIFLTLILSAGASAQVILPEPSKMAHYDSLMIAGEFRQIKRAFEASDSLFFRRPLLEYKDIASYSRFKSSYLNFVDVLDLIARRDSVQFIARFYLRKNLFRAEVAGPQAAAKFEEFQKQVAVKLYAEAKKTFFVADFLRRKFLFEHLTRRPQVRELAPLLGLEDILKEAANRQGYAPSSGKSAGARSIAVRADVPGAAVFLDFKYLGVAPLSIDAIDARCRTLHVIKHGYHTFRRYIPHDANPSVRIDAVLGEAWFEITNGPADSEVIVDGEIVGTIPTEKRGVLAGHHEISINAPGYRSKHLYPGFEHFESKVIRSSLKPLTRSMAIVQSALFPGLGQRYLHKKTKALKFLTMEAAAIAGIFFAHRYVNHEQRIYDDLVFRYEGLYGSRDIPITINDVRHQERALQEMKNVRTILIGAALGTWVWSIIDAATYREKPPFRISSHLNRDSEGFAVGLSLKL